MQNIKITFPFCGCYKRPDSIEVIDESQRRAFKHTYARVSVTNLNGIERDQIGAHLNTWLKRSELSRNENATRDDESVDVDTFSII